MLMVGAQTKVDTSPGSATPTRNAIESRLKRLVADGRIEMWGIWDRTLLVGPGHTPARQPIPPRTAAISRALAALWSAAKDRPGLRA